MHQTVAPASGASTQDQAEGRPSHNQAWPRGQGEPGSGQSTDTCPTLCTADDNMGGQDSKVPTREIHSSVSSVAAMRGGGVGFHCPCALLPGCWGDVLSSGTVALSLSPSAGTPTAPSVSLSPRVVSVHLQPLASTGFSPRLTEMLIRDQVTTVSVGGHSHAVPHLCDHQRPCCDMLQLCLLPRGFAVSCSLSSS